MLLMTNSKSQLEGFINADVLFRGPEDSLKAP